MKVESSSVMNIEKFVEADSIDPIYYASSYYLAPDGDAGRDVYAVLLQAIAETGKVALARVVIGQRERTIALRAMPGGLVAHTLDEQRDINDAKSILGDAAEIKTDPRWWRSPSNSSSVRPRPTIRPTWRIATRRGYGR